MASGPLAGHHPCRASGGGGASHSIHRHHFTLPGLTASTSHYRLNSHRSHSSRFQPVNVIMVHSSTGQCVLPPLLATIVAACKMKAFLYHDVVQFSVLRAIQQRGSEPTSDRGPATLCSNGLQWGSGFCGARRKRGRPTTDATSNDQQRKLLQRRRSRQWRGATLP